MQIAIRFRHVKTQTFSTEDVEKPKKGDPGAGNALYLSSVLSFKVLQILEATSSDAE